MTREVHRDDADLEAIFSAFNECDVHDTIRWAAHRSQHNPERDIYHSGESVCTYYSVSFDGTRRVHLSHPDHRPTSPHSIVLVNAMGEHDGKPTIHTEEHIKELSRAGETQVERWGILTEFEVVNE